MPNKNIVRLRPITKWQDFLNEELLRHSQLLADNAVQLPKTPEKLDDLDLEPQFLINLLLKYLLFQSSMSERELIDKSLLPLSLIQELLTKVVNLGLVCGNKNGTENRFEMRYELTATGIERSREAYYYNRYAGPVPVSFDSYIKSLQSSSQPPISSMASVSHTFNEIVLEKELQHNLLAAVEMPGSLLLYGPSGNGKTLLAKALTGLLRGVCTIPRAIEVNKHCISLFDPSIHRPVKLRSKFDQRWVPIHRPAINFSELIAPETLEFHYDELHHLYEAPIQLKANGGVISLDNYSGENSFQQTCLNKLLNPLNEGMGNFFFPNGWSCQVPFSAFFIITSNRQLEDSFTMPQLEKIQSKIMISAPTAAEYSKIFALECEKFKLKVTPRIIEKLLGEFYQKENRLLAAGHPSIIIKLLLRFCRANGLKPQLNWNLLRKAAKQYFGS